MKKLLTGLLHLAWRLAGRSAKVPGRWRLGWTMARLMIRQHRARPAESAAALEERFLDYRLSFFDYPTLVGLLDEIFVERVYDFKTASPTPLIVDCGSNIGLSALYFKRSYPDAHVLCFEPDQEAFAQLSKNVQNNNLQGVELHCRAVLDKQGPVSFFSDQDHRNRVGMSVTRRLADRGMRLDENRVEAVLLSAYLDRTVDLLKLDVEGAELKVLRELAEKKKLELIQQMVIEYHYDRSNADNSLAELLRLLEQSGFRYLPHSPYRPPFHAHAERPYSFLLYAYRSRADHLAA
jgi:FkbM family methyltransferase